MYLRHISITIQQPHLPDSYLSILVVWSGEENYTNFAVVNQLTQLQR